MMKRLIDRNFSEAISDKGNTYLSMGKYEESLELFDKAKDINPNDPRIWHNKAYAYYNLGKLKQAIISANKATDLAPNYVSAWGLQRICYSTIGDNKNADYVSDRMKGIDNSKTFEKTQVYRHGEIGTIISHRF